MESDRDRAIDTLEDLSYAVDYAVIGPRDNRVHETRTTQFPFNTVCHIERDFGDGLWRGCTGTLIAPRIVLTAGHCVYNYRMRRAPARIRVSPGRADRVTMPYGFIISMQYYVPRRFARAPIPIHPDYRKYDYGIIILPRAFQGIREFMAVRALSNDEYERLKHNRLFTIAGYPADRPIGTLWRHTEQLKRVTPRRLFYTVDTCPGHSGSPIWYKEGQRRYIIGVHTSGPIDESGRAYGCSRGTLYAPPGMMNSGVRIIPEVVANINNPNRRIAGLGAMIKLP